VFGKPIKKRRWMPSPAMIVAILALIVALGGSAYAASKISGTQIKNNSISLKKLNRHARIATVNLPANGPGQPGAEGKEGAAGHNGSNGNEGKAGENGKNGEKGEQGDTGPQGSPGTPGAAGPQGAQGDPGSPGSPGATGPAGPQGPQGEPGLNSGEPRVVTTGNLQGWKLATYGDNSKTPEPGYPEGRGPEAENVENGRLEFTTPLSPPPLGTQSLKMTTTAGHPVVAYVPLPAGNPPLLSELTSAGYDSLVTASSSEFHNVAFQIEMVKSSAHHFSSGYTTMVYEPYQNGENTVVGEWRHHVIAAGGQHSGLVWSTHELASGNCSQEKPCELSQFIEENPEAVVLDAKLRIGENSGNEWPGFEAYVDDVRLGFGEYSRYDMGG
jgi:hypothetical protein